MFFPQHQNKKRGAEAPRFLLIDVNRLELRANAEGIATSQQLVDAEISRRLL